LVKPTVKLLDVHIGNWLYFVVLLFGDNPQAVPRLIQHSVYVGVVEKSPPLPLTGEQYGKMEPKYPEGGHCQSVLRTRGVFNVPLYVN